MPITSLIENQQNKAEFSIGRDVELSHCSDACLLSKLDNRARVVRTGQTGATTLTVILGEGDHLLVPLAGSPRTALHVLGVQSGLASARTNWEKLVNRRHPSLMPVYRVCDCMAEVQILDGEEFEDAATTPAWKKVRGIVGKQANREPRNHPPAFDQWRAWMGDLAQGLAELESLGLAHGDPYPFNAVFHSQGATWVDFGHLTDDPDQRLKDAWVFVLFTVLHTLRKCAAYSPSLVRNLAATLAQQAGQTGRFERIRAALLQHYDDQVFADDVRAPSQIFAEAMSEHASAIFSNPMLSPLLLKTSVQYFSDFLHHLQRGGQFFTAFHLERQRHRFQEKEMLRLMVPKAESAQHDDKNDRRLTSPNQLIVEKNEKLIDLNELLAQKDEQIDGLNRLVATHNAHVQHLMEVTQTQYERLTQLLGSHSWRLTRPVRAVAQLARWGNLTDGYSSKIHYYAKRAYDRIPIPDEKKLILRSYLLKITGWILATSAVANAKNLLPALDAAASPPHVGTAAQKSSDPGFSSLIHLQSLGNRVPYFGVRRPEGRRRVAILTNQLLDWKDGRLRFGGGERYALELARLLDELTFDVTFYQPSFKAPGVGEYYGFKVILLSTADSTGEFHHGLCSEFTELTKDFDHVYYHLPEYASGRVREDGLMTCHGIWFDHNNYPGSIFRTPEWFQQLYSAFASPRCVVSVDTNSIGVIRSLWPELASNMRFIPNFYDATSYFPKPESRNADRLTILFPRRSQINRGSRIFGEIISLIPYDVNIIWLGEGDPVDTQIVKDVCKKDKRANFAVSDFDQMPQWYQKADIAVIPTIACEGTSLSCIEALAVGCAVVSTNVGGLPDLIYDGMNGLLVDPEARSIAAAINRLIVDRELRERLQRCALETAHHFELKNWRVRWSEVLRDHGWISDRAISAWREQQDNRVSEYEIRKSEKWLILTRNAIHGGVESLIREEAKGLNAPVVVCGGHDRKSTCPFEYTRADDAKTLTHVIAQYDVVLYHWLPDWCLGVLRQSGKRCIEFVHRTDTAESDKTIPAVLVTHSAFLARYINDISGRSCRVVDHPIAIDRFKPPERMGKFVGAITSYYDTKGIDIFLQAWSLIKNRFPGYGVRFYGAGDDLPKFRKLASSLGLDVDFFDATNEPWEAMKDFACFVVPSRIEGLPVAILEALAMNIPVVASDLPGMVEFNELSETRGYSRYVHLAKKEDSESFAAVLSQVLTDGGLKNSSVYINDYYNPKKHCEDLVSIYRELSY